MGGIGRAYAFLRALVNWDFRSRTGAGKSEKKEREDGGENRRWRSAGGRGSEYVKVRRMGQTIRACFYSVNGSVNTPSSKWSPPQSSPAQCSSPSPLSTPPLHRVAWCPLPAHGGCSQPLCLPRETICPSCPAHSPQDPVARSCNCEGTFEPIRAAGHVRRPSSRPR